MDDLLTTNELAAALGIGREAARLLMKETRGVVTLNGQRETRRMPRKVFESLLIQLSNKRTFPSQT